MIRGEHVHGGWIFALAGVAVTAAAGAIAIAGSLSSDAPLRPAAPPSPPPGEGSARLPAAAPQVLAPPGEGPAATTEGVNAGAWRDPAPRATPTRPACPAAVGLRFAYGDAMPPAEAAAALAPIVAYLAAHPGATAVIDGHADPTGTLVQNLALSRWRARRVADLLVQRGADRARVVERAFGAYVPLIGENGAALRRVRVAIHHSSCEQEDRP